MEAITVFTTNGEQSRVLKAFLKALQISYLPSRINDLAVLEARLSPKQRLFWEHLKNAILEVEAGSAEPTSWEDFKTELAHDHSVAQTV